MICASRPLRSDVGRRLSRITLFRGLKAGTEHAQGARLLRTAPATGKTRVLAAAASPGSALASSSSCLASLDPQSDTEPTAWSTSSSPRPPMS